MDFAAILATVGLLGLLAMLILLVLLFLANAKQYLFILKYPFAVCWTYSLGLIFSSGEIVNIDDSSDELFYFLLTIVSAASAIWVFYILGKYLIEKISAHLKAHPIKRKYAIVGILCVLFLSVALPPVIGYVGDRIRLSEEKRLLERYCTFSDYSLNKSDTLRECAQYLFELSDEHLELLDEMEKNYPSWRESAKDTHTLLETEINCRYKEQFDQLLANCSADICFSSEDIYMTFCDHGEKIERIIEYNEAGNYSTAFSMYLDIHNRHEEDCAYYLISNISPTVFSKGIDEALQSVDVYDGQEKLDEIVAYIDSRPMGRSGYETAIATVQQQLSCEIAEQYAADLERMQNTTSGYPFYVGMRESQLEDTVLGKPDSVELCRDFYKLQTRAQSKTYEWESTNDHGWYKVTVRYRKHNSNRFDDYEDLPSDNGYVSSITWSNGDGIQFVSYADNKG